MKKLYETYREVILYLICGAMAMFVSIATYALFTTVFGWHELTANVLSWVLACALAYVTNSIWVFRKPPRSLKELGKQISSFFGGRIATLLIEELILFVFVTLLHWNGILVKTAAQVVVIVLNYVISKWIIFRKEETEDER